LYIDEENGLVTLPNRFSQLIKGYGYDQQISNIFLSIFQGVKLDLPEYETLKIEDIIEIINPNLIIIDSLVRCMVGIEDRSEDVRRIFDHIKKINKKKNRACVILHHVSKSYTKGLHGLRGSGDLGGMAEAVYMFHTRHNGYGTMHIEKNRHIDTTQMDSVNFKIDSNKVDSIRFDFVENPRTGSAISDCISDIKEHLAGEGNNTFRPKGIEPYIKKLGHSRDTMYKAISDMKDNHEIKQTKRGVYELQKQSVIEEYVEDE